MKIWLTAEEFGFGPVSKVCAVARELKHLFPFEFLAHGSGIVSEFFEREGFLVRHNPEDVCSCDLAIVGVSPTLAKSISDRGVPLFYIDSLSFMWDADYFQELALINNLVCYFCQDVFDAAQSLKKHAPFGFPWKPIGAVVQTYGTIATRCNKKTAVFHLGGMCNPFNDGGRTYASLISPIITTLNTFYHSSSVICSNKAAQTLKTNIPYITAQAHSRSISLIAQADAVYTSPGLTTLLEAAALGVEVILLPPQNLSQLLILDRIQRLFPANRLLSTLLSHYPNRHFSTEEEGVYYVANTNRDLAQHGHVPNLYRENTDTFKIALGHSLATDYDGARNIAHQIYSWSHEA